MTRTLSPLRNRSHTHISLPTGSHHRKSTSGTGTRTTRTPTHRFRSRTSSPRTTTRAPATDQDSDWSQASLDSLLRHRQQRRFRKHFRPCPDLSALARRSRAFRRSKVLQDTDRKKLNTFSLLQRFAAANGRVLSEKTAILFLQSYVEEIVAAKGPQASLSGVTDKAKHLKSLFKRKGWGLRRLEEVLSATLVGDHGLPDSQAKPIPQNVALLVVSELRRHGLKRAALVAWLMWKLASRCAETLRLVPFRHLVFSPAHPDCVAIRWLTATKIGRRRPFAICNFTLLRANPGRKLDRDMLALLKGMKARHPDRVLSPFTTSRRFMTLIHARIPASRPYTAGSWKRGARAHLDALDGVDETALMRLLKHSAKEKVPDVTPRYAADPFNVARKNGTGELTRRL